MPRVHEVEEIRRVYPIFDNCISLPGKSNDSCIYHVLSASSTKNLAFGGTQVGWMGLRSMPVTIPLGYFSATGGRSQQQHWEGRSEMRTFQCPGSSASA